VKNTPNTSALLWLLAILLFGALIGAVLYKKARR